MLAPLLFNIFFAAILLIALQRFSEDADILADLVPGMLYADEACIVSRSPRGLELMTAVIVKVFGAFGLTVSEKKTETMQMPIPRGNANHHQRGMSTRSQDCLVRLPQGCRH